MDPAAQTSRLLEDERFRAGASRFARTPRTQCA
jgi:hypothetical protein